jgi:hypothetical protein
MGSGSRASRKWSRARSGFRAHRERCSIRQGPQVCGSVIRKIVVSSQSGEPLAPLLAPGENRFLADSLKNRPGQSAIREPREVGRRNGSTTALVLALDCQVKHDPQSRVARITPDGGSAAS